MRAAIRWLPIAAALTIVGTAVAVTTAAPASHASAAVIDATGASVGSIKLVEDATGRVHVNVQVAGLTPGRHGIHIHAVGSCSPDFLAAGPHYNPFGRQHGLENVAGPHAGDLPNLVVNTAGIGRLEASTDRVTLTGGPATLFDANGSAFIIHANEDDQLTDATNGGSGGRIACAVVVAG
jgi:Cu-Zn family superoxide dismutase